MKTRNKPFRAVPKPNRFLYHLGYGYTIAGRAYFSSDQLVANRPLTDPRDIKGLEERYIRAIRERIKAKDAGGAAIVGVQNHLEVTVGILNIIQLNAYLEPDAQLEAPAPEPEPTQPEDAA